MKIPIRYFEKALHQDESATRFCAKNFVKLFMQITSDITSDGQSSSICSI